MRLVILGGPGSGKGTQAKRLSDYFKIPIISTGNILRNAISEQTQLGKKAQYYVERGELLPNEIMIEFMREHLEKNELDQGWILEGYPRTAFQAEELDFLLETLEQKLNYGIYLQVSEPVMKARSLRRSLMDDQPEIIERRINMFKQYTTPLIDYYQGTKRLLTIAGEASTDEVGQEILSKIIH